MKISTKSSFLLGTAVFPDGYTAGGFKIFSVELRKILDTLPKTMGGFSQH
jgi:hypothetical protein